MNAADVKELIAMFRSWYRDHGTKILGTLSAGMGTLQAVLAALTADPSVHLLVTPKTFAYLTAVNIALGIMVLRRGFTNSKPPQ